MASETSETTGVKSKGQPEAAVITQTARESGDNEQEDKSAPQRDVEPDFGYLGSRNRSGGKAWRQMQQDAESLRWQGVKLLKKVGSGSVSTVYQAEDLNRRGPDGKPPKIAVRAMDWTSVLGDYQRSIYPHLLKTYKNMPPHPNVVRVLKRLVDGHTTFLLLEWCPLGSLRAALRPDGTMPRGMAEGRARDILTQICEGLEFLRQNNVPHGRLTSENILLAEGFKVKLTDYGYPPSTCSNCTDDDLHLRYRAPELLRGKPFTAYAADIWSVGVVLYEMLHAALPYSARDVANAERCINMPPLELRASLSYPCVLLLKRLLTFSPMFRPTMQSVFSDPWMLEKAKVPGKHHPQCCRDHSASEPVGQHLAGRVEEGEGEVGGGRGVGSPPHHYRQESAKPRGPSLPPPPPPTTTPAPAHSYATRPDSSKHHGDSLPTKASDWGEKDRGRGAGGEKLGDKCSSGAPPVRVGAGLVGADILRGYLRKLSPVSVAWHKSFLKHLCEECLEKELREATSEKKLARYMDKQGRRMSKRVADMFVRFCPTLAQAVDASEDKKGEERAAESTKLALSTSQALKDQLLSFLKYSERTRAKFFRYYAGVIPPNCREFPLPPVTITHLKGKYEGDKFRLAR